jgi:hypothetical protein
MTVREFLLLGTVAGMVVCVASGTRGTAQEEPRMEYLRARICLNGVWELSEGGTKDQVPTAGWRAVRVPEEFGDWSRESAWYRLRFRVPAEFAGKRVVLEVGRIRFYGKAWVNGVPVGESWQPRLPLVADVTGAVKAGQENELLVFAHCLAEGYSNPGEPLQDAGARGALLDYYDTQDMAAIMGDVFLSCHPAVSVSDVFIMPSVRRGELRLRAWVANDGPAPVAGTLACQVTREGKTELTLPEASVQLAPGETKEVESVAKWPDAVLWGPPPFGELVLYHLQSDLLADGRLLDRRYDRFGFREVWAEGNEFRFNGKPIFLMGTHISDFEMREAMTLLVPKLQQAGFLFVHPHADNRLEAFYDVCDELGMMVWDSSYCGGPIGNSLGKWGTRSADTLPAAKPYLEDMYRGWVRRNRNHASVTFWTAGCNNEPVNGALKQVIEKEDATRPVVIYGVPENEREVQMFGFPGWGTAEPDYTKGTAALEAQVKRRGDLRYPLFIGEYWSQSGRPRAMEITHDLGIGGGCTFDVGGYRGCFPPFPTAFAITWPSQSGVGQHRTNLLLRGHKKTFPEVRHPNWCDPAKPVFAGEWAEEAGYREVSEKANGHLGVATRRVPEVIVTVSRAGKPVAGEHVLLFPASSQAVSPAGVMTDPEGKAWFVLQEPGTYRAECGGRAVTFEASYQPLKLDPGYGYIQWVTLGD